MTKPCLWKPASIMVGLGDNKDPVDILSYLSDPTDPYNDLKRNGAPLKFPTDVYPADWSSRNIIEKAIIEAAALVNVSLVRSVVDRTGKQGQKSGKMLPTVVLKCDEAEYYRRKSTNDVQRNLGKAPIFGQSIVKDGIKIASLVNPNKGRVKQAINDPKRTETLKPSKETSCQCSIRLKLQPGEYWFIAPCTGCAWHNHAERLQWEKRPRFEAIPEDEVRRAVSVARHGGASAAVGVLNEFTNRTYSFQQVAHVTKQYDLADGHVLPAETADGSTRGMRSDADDLIRHLEMERKKGNLSYIALYHNVDESTLHTVRKADLRRMNGEADVPKKKKKRRKKATEPHSSESSETPSMSLQVDTKDGPSVFTVTGDDALDIGLTLCPIQRELRVGQKILLAVAWVRDDERRLFELFPEVFVVDVTYGTNREGRPLITSCAFDQNMKTFTPIRSFAPSECGWVFQWYFETAVPSLLPKEALSRTQLVITDGDTKMYNAFDSVRDRFYPNAVHGLCIYHLVTQPLKKLRLMDADDDIVKGMVRTFKLWVFEWMYIDGVEDEKEYKSSLEGLERWLSYFAHGTNTVHSYNAKVLHEFLNTTLLRKKERWFAPGRQGRLTFDQKTTSALESVHRVTKAKEGLGVRPNMTLLGSFRRQQQQVDKRMHEYRLKAAEATRGRCLFSHSPTSNVVSVPCETQIIRQKQESEHYTCRLLGPFEIEVKRLPETNSHCIACQSAMRQGDECCATHSATSPITRHGRVRRVSVRFLGNELYEVVCSCPYHRTNGIPCRHVMLLIGDVLPNHVHVRWKRAMAAHYKDDRYPQVTAEFHARCCDRRLIVDDFEYKLIHRNATLRQEQDAANLPITFWQDHGPKNPSPRGLVPAIDDTEDNEPGVSVKDARIMQSDICLSQQAEEDGYEDQQPDIIKQLSMCPMQSSDLFLTTKSLQQRMAEMAKLSNDPEVSSYMLRAFNECFGTMREMIIAKHTDKRFFAGEVVSACVPMDKRRKFVRIKGAHERNKRTATTKIDKNWTVSKEAMMPDQSCE